MALSVVFGIFALSACALAQYRGVVRLVPGSQQNVQGSLTFTQTPEGLLINGEVIGLEPGLHGFHIHQKGDLTEGCASTGGHYNPLNATHGAPTDHVRHAGDLGNIEADAQGIAKVNILDAHISLAGPYCVLGRAVVVHEKADDLGRGNNEDSLKTGNAGGRVACGVIGLA